MQGLTSPALLADMVGNLLDVKNEDKQELLETFDLPTRLDKVLKLLAERVGVLRISKEIGDKTKKEFDERQREHVLREQMRQIQKELGEGEDTGAELAELKKKIDEAGMPEDVYKHAVKELKRLQRMGEGSAEGSMLRTYLEWLAELPWKDEPQKHRHCRGAEDPRRGPLRPGQDQAPDPRAPRGAQAESDRQEPDPVLRRPAGRRQDLARPVDRARHRAQVPAHRARRRARRGRDPRPPAHLHRRAARQRDPGAAARRVEEHGADVRRDRQARPGRLPRRPVERAARGARSRSRTPISATTTSASTSTCRR